MKSLEHKQQIRVKGFRHEPEIFIGTISGYAIQNGESPEVALKRAKEFGHEIEPWTSQSPSVLEGNYSGKADALKAKSERFHLSVEIEEGEVVEIEGFQYKVSITGQQYCDPVKFNPIS